MGRLGIGSVVAACLVAGAASAGQSLVEVAEKERERRAEVSKPGGPSAVISERDLEEARGDSFSLSGQAPGASGESEAEEPAPPAGLSAKEVRDLREEWARVWKGQMEQAEKELEQAKDDLYQCRAASRYFFVPLAVDCRGVDLRLAGAEARLKKIRRTRYRWDLLLPPSLRPGS